MSRYLTPEDTLKYNAYLIRKRARRHGTHQSQDIVYDILFADFCGYAIKRVRSGEFVTGFSRFEFSESPLLDENYVFSDLREAMYFASQNPNDPTEIVLIFDIAGNLTSLDLVRSVSVENIIRSKWSRS